MRGLLNKTLLTIKKLSKILNRKKKLIRMLWRDLIVMLIDFSLQNANVQRRQKQRVTPPTLCLISYALLHFNLPIIDCRSEEVQRAIIVGTG